MTTKAYYNPTKQAVKILVLAIYPIQNEVVKSLFSKLAPPPPFMPTSSEKINQRIEAVCGTGCEAVRASIEMLESGHQITLTDDLNEEECKQVLTELKTIMSVYDNH